MSAGDLITGPGQLQWRSLLLGPGTDYDLKDLSGWEDLPPVDVGSKTKPRGHGADPGRLLAQPHAFTAVLDINPLASGGTGAARAFLRGQTGLPDDTRQEPVAVCLDTGITMLRFGQLTARKIPFVVNYENVIKDVALQWQCADPRLYSSTLKGALLALPAGAPGVPFPAPFPIVFPAAGMPSSATVTNTGNAPTPPVYTFTGPNTSPVLTLQDANGQRQTVFNLALAAGESLVVDVLNKTVKVGGADRYGFSSGTVIEQLELIAGATTVTFNGTGNAAASLQVSYRDATI